MTGTDTSADTLTRRPIQWRRATLRDTRMETRTARTLVFDVPGWTEHRAGQHVDVKLTAEDGYSAQRSYSIASASAPGRVELTVQAISDGEVSPYLVETMTPGDELELRGPIGGWFQWTERLTEPVLLVGGGSGIVPLMAMLRERSRADSIAPFHLVYVARTPDHVFYANELYSIGRSTSDVTIERLYTRAGLPDDHRTPGRLGPEDVPPPTVSETGSTRVYVCGPTGFVESATRLLQDRGHEPSAIRTERFGPTGG
jgi:ferredoxin-NADP reductase